METQLYHTLLCSSPLFIALGSQFICELFPTNMRVFALFFFVVIATFLLLPNAVLCDGMIFVVIFLLTFVAIHRRILHVFDYKTSYFDMTFMYRSI